MDRAIWESGTAPQDLRDWTYRAAQAVAADNLIPGRDVVADCVNDCREARDGWEIAARRAAADVQWLEIICSDAAEHRRRVERRVVDLDGLPLPDWKTIVARAFDAWMQERLVVDTAHRTIEECGNEALARLAASPADGAA